MLRLIFIALVSMATVFPQAIAEHAIAAAGGSAAGVAGKPVSEAAISIFSKAASLLETATTGKQAAKEPVASKSVAGVLPSTPGGSAAGVTMKAVTKGSIPGFSTNAPMPEIATVDNTRMEKPQARKTSYPNVAPASSLPEVAAETFRQAKPGLKREELLTRVGTPSSKITIPDGEQLVEIYRYRANGATLGAVHLVDGKVVQVIR